MTRYLLIAGVDYGTSFTKVVLRDNNKPGSKAVIVTFPGYEDGLLPSLVGIQNGSLYFQTSSTDCFQAQYLKMAAASIIGNNQLTEIPNEIQSLDKPDNIDLVIRNLISFYFANIFAATEYFIREKSPWKNFDFTPGNQNDHLIFQIAVPAGLLNDNEQSNHFFRKAFIAGYDLKNQVTRTQSGLVQALKHLVGRNAEKSRMNSKSVHYAEWASEVNRVLKINQKEKSSRFKWQCIIYPEVAAAVQTIFRSPNAKDGLYITMDVGGGTVDINAFRRFSGHGNNKARNLDYYSAIVSPLGIHHLELNNPIIRSMTEIEMKVELKKKLKLLYEQSITKQRNLGPIPGRRTWDGVTIYIFGGGISHTNYSQLYRNTMIEGLEEVGIYNPKPLNLPKSADITVPKNVPFGRFAVAYGLSFFRPNLDNVTLPQNLPNFRNLYPAKPPKQYGLNWED